MSLEKNMAYKLVISPEAYREIELAECFYKVLGVDRLFLQDFNNQFLYLERMPLSRQIRYNTIRIHLLDNYNYSIHYVVENKNVFVLHILNQSQDF